MFPKYLAARLPLLRLHALTVDPCGDFLGIEADVLADLDERDPPLGYQTTNEPDLDSEP
jgi:hypothetical protein